jgi:F-type H+-transporting ATPase subunit delta
VRLTVRSAGIADGLEQERAIDVASEDPMMASVPGRYAAALYDLAKEQGKVADVEADLGRFAGMLAQSADLERLVRNPVFSANEQGKAIAAVVEKAQFSPLTANFLKLLARNRRLFAVADMTRSFRAIAARERGEVVAEVSSAHPLGDAQLADLKAMLKAYVVKDALGRDVAVHTKIDPSLLGGLVVKIGSRMIDSSLKTRLTALKAAMKGTG